MIRVLLADDQALLRGAFRVLVESEPDMEVVGRPRTAPKPSRWPAAPGRTSS